MEIRAPAIRGTQACRPVHRRFANSVARKQVQVDVETRASRFPPGSARASRAGDRALAIASFYHSRKGFGEGAEIGTRGRVRSPENLLRYVSVKFHRWHDWQFSVG